MYKNIQYNSYKQTNVDSLISEFKAKMKWHQEYGVSYVEYRKFVDKCKKIKEITKLEGDRIGNNIVVGILLSYKKGTKLICKYREGCARHNMKPLNRNFKWLLDFMQ